MGKRKREADGGAVAQGGAGAAPLSQPPAVSRAELEGDDGEGGEVTLLLLRAPAGFDWSRLDGARMPLHALLRAGASGASGSVGGLRVRRLPAADDAAAQLTLLCALDGEEEAAAEAAAAGEAAAGRLVALVRRGLAGTVAVAEAPAADGAADGAALAPAPRFPLLAPVALQRRLPVVVPPPPHAPRAAEPASSAAAGHARRRRTGSKASGRSR